MVRVFIKGGVWKNSEDEILKAAVMKYGKQNWSRVASLLNRKSAKQCKARWFEWLDPSVKKVEWSREEEEKLLHMAKLMPAQWRTIAPIVGRTANQCQEKYEELLDSAAAAMGKSDTDRLKDDTANVEGGGAAAKLRAGEIDAQPETKPARPDPVDMDEDEIEMLQEARARLANTEGKKAKRKGREKMLAEAKRLADLQKRRELKQAGIISANARKTVSRKKRAEIDYGVEIPFHKPAPAGFHDVQTEAERTAKLAADRLRDIDFGKLNEQNVKSRDKEASEQKKKDAQRIKALEKANMQQAVAHVSARNDPLAFRARGTLSMPAPQISDTELSAVAKQLHAANSSMPPPPSLNDNAATNALLIDYADRPLPTPMRTPASGGPQRADIIMQEALNQKLTSEGQTPLFGHENPELAKGTGFDGATPLRRGGNESVATTTTMNTNHHQQQPNETPVGRDQFGLNAKKRANYADFSDTASYASFASSVRSNAKEERRAAKKARLDLSAALAALPAPQFEYELAVPDMPKNDEDDDNMAVDEVEDAADVAARLEEIRRLEAEVEFAARTSVTKRPDELPRAPPGAVDTGNDTDESKLIAAEAAELLKYDAWKYPVSAAESGGKKSKKSKGVAPPPPAASKAKANPIENIPLSALEAAKKMLEEEAVKTLGVEAAELTRQTVEASLSGAEGMVYLGPEIGWRSGKNVTKNDLLASLKMEYDSINDAVGALAKKSDKLVQKLSIKYGGYEKRAVDKRKSIVEMVAEIGNVEIERAVYQRLGGMEKLAIPKRLGQLQEEIDSMAARQSDLQNRYARLSKA
jgi:pre-mRNA-splicing factor CDC5/CEF1